MKQIITIIISSFLLMACNGKAQNTNNKAKNNNKVNQMLQAYQKQPHRIALNGCSFSYNEQPFYLGSTIKELVAIFGDYDYHHIWSYVWEDIGIVISTDSKKEKLDDIVEYIYIYMNTTVSHEYLESLKDKLNHKKDYFLINGIPHRYDIYFSDFISHSTYDLNTDFGASNYNYFFTEICDDGKKIEYTIDVNGGIWNRKGGGHLTFKDGLNQNNDSLIEYIGVGYVEDED